MSYSARDAEQRDPLGLGEPGARPVLILITGFTGTGKTTLARRLGDRLHIPVVTRDLLRSGMAGHDGPAAFAAYYALLASHLDRRISVIGDQALHAQFAPREAAPVLEKARSVMVECVAAEHTIRARLRERLNNPDRHSSHPDAEHLEQIESGDYDWATWSVDLHLPTLRVSTDDDVYEPALDTIINWISRSAPSSQLT